MSERAPAIPAPRPVAGYGPVLLVLSSAIFWGLWWVPVRICEALGLTGVWPNFGINLGALIALSAYALFSRSSSKPEGAALLGAVLVGVAVAFYGAALSLTEVARAVLLFYLAPAWSTLIEVTFLRRRWHWKRLPPLLLSFAGMIVVFRGEVSLDHGGIGDLAALLSGITWSAGAALVFSTTRVGSADDGGVPRLSLVVMLSAMVTSTALLPLDWQGWPVINSGDVGLAVLLAIAAGAIYLAPIIGVTLWGATRLLPATISFLLAAEILSGITSSAIFLDESFGWWEITGTAMIVAGVIAHVIFDDRSDARAG
ncbi:MAG: DMT family transporter [Pseudomonadota bacterium]